MIVYRFKLLPLLVVIALAITLGLVALLAHIALAACPTTLTLTLNEDPHLLVDSNNPAAGPHVTAAYATINNTGAATAYDVYMYIGNGITPGTFNAGSDGNRLAMLSSPSYATRYIGNLAPGQSKTVYWMLTYPLTYGQTYPLTIWASNPAGCSVQASHTYTTQSTVSSQSDRILGTVTTDPSSGIVSVGNILTVTVTGFNLGTLGTNGDTWFQPVGNIDFNPACLRLVRTEVYIHSIANKCGYGSMPYIDRLYFPGIRTCYVYDPTDYAKYYFVALQEATTTIKVYQEAASGGVEKYSADYGKAAATLTTTNLGSAVTVAKSVSPLSGGANTTFTWTITYTNNTDYPVGDPQSGNGLVLIDEAIPSNTTYVAGSATCSGSCIIYYSTDNGATWNTTEPVPASSVNKLKWYINQTIAGHSSGTVSFQSRVNSGVPGNPLICNSASAKIGDGASLGVDGVCANGGVDLDLSKVVDQSTPCEDSSVTYTITVTNPSSAVATNVQVTDLLPTSLTYYSSVPSQGSYSSVSGLWTVGNVNAGASATLLLTATVNSGTGGQIIRNTATITHADQTDPVITNNSDYADILVLSRPAAAASSNSPVCHKTAIQLFGGPDGMYSYHWVGPPGSGFDEYGQNQVILPDESGYLDPDLAGSYILTVTDANGCSATATTTVDMNLECECPPTQPINLSPGNESCVQLPVQLMSSEFVAAEEPEGTPDDWLAGTEWQIRESGGDYATPVCDLVGGNVTSINVPLGTLSPGTTYYWHVKHQDNEGAWSIYSSETSFHTKPVAVADSDTPVCVGGTIQLYGGPSGMTSYNWTGPLGFNSDLQRPTISNATLGMAGTYTLTVTAANGCSDTTSISVTVQTCATPPNTPSNILPSQGTCVGLPVTLTASAFSDPGSGEYQIAAHWQIRASGGGYSDPVFDSGTDTVHLTSITIPPGILSDSSSYCWHVRHQGNLGAWSEYSSETFFCTNPVATASSNSPVCEGANIELYGGPDDMARYNWAGPDGFISSLQNPTIPNATLDMAGTYTLTVTNSNGCTDDESTSVYNSVYTCLTICSCKGGSVTTPGEGEFPYVAGTVVYMVASPDPGYRFSNWMGDVATIANVYEPGTTITMNGNYSITANFTGTALGPIAGWCFIATAAYGTPAARQIDELREFRDVVLLESTVGSQFVALYYQLSPPIAEFIARNELLRTLVRELMVDPIVWIVEATGDIWRN